MIKKWYKVTYLDCFGAMSIYEAEEFFMANSKKQAWKKFMQKYNGNPRSGYQCNFDFATMEEDIYVATNEEIADNNLKEI